VRCWMSRGFISRLRPSSGFVVVFTSSALAGGAYRYFSSRVPDETSDHLNPSSFTPYTIASKEAISTTSSIFTLRHPRHGRAGAEKDSASAVQDIWRTGIWSVQARQPELQIARSYTPLPPASVVEAVNGRPQANAIPGTENTNNPADLRLLIRAEKNGEVSNYLHSLPTSTTVDIRGPYLELELPDDLREVIFIAGGTGIAPAMQVAHILSQRPGARMHILWSTRHKDESHGGKSDIVQQTAQDQGRQRTKLEELDPWGKISRWTTWGLSSGGQKPESALEDARKQAAAADEQKSMVVKELELLKAQFDATRRSSKERRGGLTVEYFVDDDNRFIKPRDVSKQFRLVAREEVETDLPVGKKLIVVSGPEGFVSLWAGKKVWMGGKEMQGPLGGYFANLGLARQNWKVWKL
jgi:hypothetical protein